MEISLHTPPLSSINPLLASTPFNHINSPIKHPFTTDNKFRPISTAFSKIITASSSTSTILPSSFTPLTSTSTSTNNFYYWMVIIDKPPPDIILSKPKLINYYVTTLQNALCSDHKDAQRCIYDASFDTTSFGFCCFVHQQTSHLLAGMPGVLSVKPDPDVNSINKDYSYNFNLGENSVSLQTAMLFPEGSKHWLVSVEKPSTRVFSKAQMVNFYVDILTKVLGNEKDAQMCLYHASGQSDYGFCCILDDRCAQELAAVPGVLSVKPDENFDSENKTYGGPKPQTIKPSAGLFGLCAGLVASCASTPVAICASALFAWR
ncbi:hypothetical protein KSS87_021926 [Heliosperma pusillum]|nr:hypothetical protein KSS87_022780 [Heliosperma pusillum]KAH9623335.1 hypothetical protein KSS87_021926 [Heliosperma pusillum]